MNPLISKITRAKWAGSVAQVVENLLCKHKALNSNPGTVKEKKIQTILIPLKWLNYIVLSK
jgi:hypothetical protein